MLADLRFAFRSLAKSPGFTAVALLTLALGIGANTTMFSVLRTLVVRTLPYPDEDRLVYLHRTSDQSGRWPHSVANYLDLQAEQNVFAHLAAFQPASFDLGLPGEPAERLRGLQVTADFFPLLGVAPALGRVFNADEDRPGHDRVIVLSHRTWTARFARDPAIVGREIRIGGQPVTVLGVMPPGFDDPLLWGQVDAWRPMAFTDAQRANRRSNYLRVIARLKPGLTRTQAEAGAKNTWAQLVAAHPDMNAGTDVRLTLLDHGSQVDADGSISAFVTALAGLVLLIACANLANLQFARTAARAREHAVRAALGATRGRLLRALLAESLLLALGGGALGVLVALWCNDFLGRRMIVGSLHGIEFPLNLEVLVFALLASTATGAGFGLLPAWLASRTDVNDALKQGGRGITASRAQHRVRHTLIVGEVALALVLLAMASVFIHGLQRVMTRDPGWRVEGLLAGYLSLQPTTADAAEKRAAYAAQLEQKLAALPAVEHAALATALPTFGFNMTSSFLIEGRAPPTGGAIPGAALASVTPDFFATLGLRIVAGRSFAASDRSDTPAVTIVNETMARAFFPGASPLGKRLRHPDDPVWREIIGVVADANPAATLDVGGPGYQMYRPLAQNPGGSLVLAVRSHSAPEALVPLIRSAIASLNPDQPVRGLGLVRDDVAESMGNLWLAGAMLGAFALLGLVLAALGLYGVIANSVVQRTHEIGVRIALGAQVRDILRLVIGQGLRLAVVGAVLGLAGAFASARVLRAAAPALANLDVATVSGVTVLLVAVATFACWLPARRATRVDPLIALRAE
ncbi:MAG TPA: ABC transporter permease [Opitutaceae bacterium]|nr:ABC transporter permease [Opitutaceae bacterium]